MWKLLNFTATAFSLKFRQINVLLKNFTINWFDEQKLHGMAVNFTFCHTAQCGKCCDLVSHIFGKNFVKVTFLQEITKCLTIYLFGETKFFIFPHCALWQWINLLFTLWYIHNFRNFLPTKQIFFVKLIYRAIRILRGPSRTADLEFFNFNFFN